MNKKSAQKQKRYLKQRLLASRCSIKNKAQTEFKNQTKSGPPKIGGSLLLGQKRLLQLAMGYPIQSLLNIGSSGIIIEIECYISNSLPSIVIVGLGNKAVDEAKERIRSALASTKLKLPAKRIIINLAPADVPKDSTSLDLGIATAILAASGQIKYSFGKDQAVIGELGLDGTIRPVRGIIGKLLLGKEQGITTFFVPQGNLYQALLVPEITVIPLPSISEFYAGLTEQKSLSIHRTGHGSLVHISQKTQDTPSVHDVVGQARAKRALEIAAAGGHNTFLSGPPGTGKSMLAKALPSILPPLSQAEILEITHLHSLASNQYDRLITSRPFRSPHHSASHIALLGGGHNLRPGEISLSHRGVLFMDELPEFNRAALEGLRQPLEDRTITITRIKDSATYPANFILVATANPCPCGYYGSSHNCRCSASQIQHYRQRISGPIMDRIDLYVEVEEVNHEQLLDNNKDRSESLNQRILQARKIQENRYKITTFLNADMSNTDIKKYSRLSAPAKTLLNEAATRLNLSPRSYMRVIKVARTIADLDHKDEIELSHISEALQYRGQNLSDIS